MATGENWTQDELDLTVAAYLKMLYLEQSGIPYNKTEFRRALLPLLHGRTEGSIEMKHQNISAALIRMNVPYITGYKPRFNYQQALAHTITAHTANHTALHTLLSDVAKHTYAPADMFLINEPPPEPYNEQLAPEIIRHPRMIDYVKREAENRALGLAGERLVFQTEQQRLIQARRDDLAAKVEWISQTSGDGAGFDILSFDEQTDRERLIEVKTTNQGKHFPFYASRNEVQLSEERPADYQLQRIFTFRDRPRLYTLNGALSQTCKLDPTQYEARPGHQK